MKIRSMTACFGALSGDSLSLEDGLNVICLPNEGGKSTWCAFIRAMLYGVSTSQREKSGVKPDKVRYAPWSGAPMQGELLIEHAGREITLRRGGKPSQPFRDFSAVYTGTANPVPGLGADGAGEELTGVPRAVFERSAFISQAGVGLTSSPELERRIAAIVSTGEETGSFSEADERLRAWQRKRRFRRHGALAELEAQILADEAELDAARDELQEMDRLLQRAEQLRKDCLELTRGVSESRKRQRRETFSRLSAAKARLAAAGEKLESRNAELRRRREEYANDVFQGGDPETLRHGVAGDYQKALALEKLSGERITPLAAIILSLLGFAFMPLELITRGFILAGALLVVCGVILFVRYAVSLNRQKRARAELGALLSKYGAEAPRGIEDAFFEHESRFEELLDAQMAARLAAEELENLREIQEGLEAELLGGEGEPAGGAEAERLSRQLARSEAELASIREKCAMIEGRLGALGDPVVFGTRLENKKARQRELSGQYDALELAIATLRDADDELQTRFSPRLARRAAEYLNRLTGGRYGDLSLSRDMSALVREAGGTAVRETDFLSAGTVDQVYLALRLAICELALPGENPCPLILDDVLINFDRERAAAALELFRELSETRQIILFTCRENPGAG